MSTTLKSVSSIALCRVAALVLLGAMASGCATIKGWFNDVKKENIQPPTPLEKDFVSTLPIQKIWSTRIGKGAEKTGARMQPAYADGKLYAASTTGVIESYDAAAGKTLWSKHVGKRRGFIWHHGDNSVRFGGGPAANGDIVVVGTLEGQAMAFNATDGGERWTAQLSSEIISAPAIGDDLVVVRTHDGHVYGLNRSDGARRWVYDRATVPLLSLRGNSSPVLAGVVVYAGEDNGKVLALRASDGAQLWEQTISAGEGRTDIDRLQDVDGDIAVADNIVYASGYRGQAAALSAQNGRPLWTRELSSFSGVAISATEVYASDPDSNVYGVDLRTGSSEWKQDALKYRWLGAPAVQGSSVVVGDVEGWVHWLSLSDGKLLARERVSKHPIQGAPVVVGDTLYVEDIYGELAAYRVGK